ncbi:D-alanine--D-alanine ligase [Kitasatospora sp. NPDC088134]|uniref:D-alanine--D-alanine ligase family protein n=1 Tax=Kitasatospora sp. NPDC088134 TaxID=3364071 RepID=UPI00380450EB
MNSIRKIAVVTGGRSEERDRSLLSGKAVHEALARMGIAHTVLDASAPEFVENVKGADLAFMAIAGQYSEDGKLQGLLDSLGTPYTGSGVLASALGMHKPTAKQLVHAAGVPVLPHLIAQSGDDPRLVADQVAQCLGFPVIVKPASEGGSIGMTIIRETGALAAAIGDGREWLIEPFVTGTAVTCGIITRDGRTEALPPLETLPTDAEFYDYRAKRNPDGHRYRCPAELPPSTIKAIQDAAVKAHDALSCHGYSSSDFMVTATGELHWLEINTLPGLSPQGNLATMANAAGYSYDQLIGMIIASAHRDGYRP